MTTVYDVKGEPLVEEAAEDLEEMFDAPEFTRYAKSGSDRDRPPQQDNWYHLRSAAILRKVYMDGPVGVSRLRKAFGKREEHGHGPEHKGKASGKVIRSALQNLEDQGLVEEEEGEGRVITDKGMSFLDEKAAEL